MGVILTGRKGVMLSDILGFAQLAGMIISIVWGISKINTTTQVLTNSITTLDRTIGKLETAIEKVEAKIGDHGERIAVLENG